MKTLLFSAACFFLSTVLPAQALLNDAILIQEYFDVTDSTDPDKRLIFNESMLDNTAHDFLKLYLPEGAVPTTFTIEKAFKGNPFLRVEVTSQNSLNSSKSLGISAFNTAKGATGGFSVAGFADGLSRFLVTRTKQELSDAFFSDFKNEVENNPYLGHFCPATKQNLLLVDQDVYQFKDYLAGLRESFTMDMTSLPGNMESFLRDPVLCQNCEQEEAGKVMIDLLHLAQQLVNGEPSIDMIDYLASQSSAIQSAQANQPVLYDMAGGLRFLRLVSESLRNPASQDSLMPWFTGPEIRKAFRDPKIFQLYMGLLWQQAADISFINAGDTKTLTLRSILTTAQKTSQALASWRNALESLGETTHSLQRSVRASASTPSSVSDDFYRYSQAFTNLLKSINQTGKLVLGKSTELVPDTYIFLLQQCNGLYFNVRQRNYTGAISNVIYCLDELGKNKSDVATLLKYANFVASIAEANSPEEVENAIELFALPPGSSRMKKQPGRFAVALNAYSGLAGGREYLGSDKTYKPYGAITAPVGLSLSWGLGKHGCKKDKGHDNNPGQHHGNDKQHQDDKLYEWGSLGFFVPLIDVGAVTAFRFRDTTTQDLPELTWANILSPGLFLVYDFPGKWPIAFGIGGQAGPGLRTVSVAGNDIQKSGIHYGAFLTVDIPITYLYLGKGRKVKDR